ncbi:MAG: GreA/GreB family elongation factor [Brumimicrobium sp.]|nr:GreA/GreB family elongation factor [Brumimicrobium sp.]
MTGVPKPIEFKIVGVDEADVKEHKIAFVSPIAKALIGNKTGDKLLVNLAGKAREIEILEISY